MDICAGEGMLWGMKHSDSPGSWRFDIYQEYESPFFFSMGWLCFRPQAQLLKFNNSAGYRLINGIIMPISVKIDATSKAPGLFLRLHSIGFRFKNGPIIKKIHKKQLNICFGKTVIKAGEILQGSISMPYMKGAPMELVLVIEKYNTYFEFKNLHLNEPDQKKSVTSKTKLLKKTNRKFMTLVKKYDSSLFKNLPLRKTTILSVKKDKRQFEQEGLFLKKVKEKMNGSWSTLTRTEQNRRRAFLKYQMLYKH